MNRHSFLSLIILLVSGGAARADVSAADYPSPQAAIDANPGATIRVPAGEYRIDQALIIRASGTTLEGRGTIIQGNPAAPILRVDGANNVLVRDLTLTRAEGARETTEDGFRADNCVDLTLDNVRVLENWSTSAAIRLLKVGHARVAGCRVVNYKRVGLEDRTASPEHGYAFRAILGDGIFLSESSSVIVAHNEIRETRLRATAETKKAHDLGRLVDGRAPTRKGRFAPPEDYATNWHQGSAIVVTSPTETDRILVTGNEIENAAQGVDIHADRVTFSDNVIAGAMVGIKCMHGSRNVVIAGNNVSGCSLWGLVMLPGTAARRINPTRGNIVANNIFSDFGRGDDYHNWAGTDSRRVLSFEAGPDADSPPLADVIISGNLVYDTEREEVESESARTAGPAEPRYLHALYIDPRLDRGTFRLSGNLFHPGTRGESNGP